VLCEEGLIYRPTGLERGRGFYLSAGPSSKRARWRHLSAIRTLAQIRKLGPAMQINIAEKQINTAV
jgi:hypothetical protein